MSPYIDAPQTQPAPPSPLPGNQGPPVKPKPARPGNRYHYPRNVKTVTAPDPVATIGQKFADLAMTTGTKPPPRPLQGKVTTETPHPFMARDKQALIKLHNLPRDADFEKLSDGGTAILKKVKTTAPEKAEDNKKYIAVKFSKFAPHQRSAHLAKLTFSPTQGEILGLTVPDHDNIIKPHMILLLNHKTNEYQLIEKEKYESIKEHSTRDELAQLHVRASISAFSQARELKELLLNNEVQPEIELAIDVAGKVCNALIHLHDNNLIYRDLKPENILYAPPTEDSKSTVKLVDMGFLKELGKGDITRTFCGTKEYMAPEIVERKEYTHAVDAWSLGILLFELSTDTLPFNCRELHLQGLEILRFAQMSCSGKVQSMSKMVNQRLRNEPEFLKIIAQLTEYNPNRRMTLETAKTKLENYWKSHCNLPAGTEVSHKGELTPIHPPRAGGCHKRASYPTNRHPREGGDPPPAIVLPTWRP